MSHQAGNGAQWPEPGQSYRDPAGGAVVLVLTPPRWPGVLRCEGVAMARAGRLPCSYHSRTGVAAALRPGRRYRDPVSGLEVRCLRGGNGHLTYEDWLLAGRDRDQTGRDLRGPTLRAVAERPSTSEATIAFRLLKGSAAWTLTSAVHKLSVALGGPATARLIQHSDG